MAEAKEKSLAPALPSDMQAVLKRSEALEKEVRSLKFNLSFMNRYGSFLSLVCQKNKVACVNP